SPEESIAVVMPMARSTPSAVRLRSKGITLGEVSSRGEGIDVPLAIPIRIELQREGGRTHRASSSRRPRDNPAHPEMILFAHSRRILTIAQLRSRPQFPHPAKLSSSVPALKNP